MGYSRALRYAGPIALAVGLVGCSDSTGKRMWSRDEITDIADDSVDASELPGEVDRLTARVNALEARVSQQRVAAPVAAEIERRRESSFDLMVGNQVRRSFSSADSCEAAKQSVFQQARENCPKEAAFCSPPTAYCIGE